LEYGGNDSDYDWQSIAEHPEIEHHPRTRLEVFEQAYERVVNKIKQLGAVPLVLSLPPMDAERYFAFFSAPFGEKGRQNVLNWLGGTTNTIMSGHELYNLATMRVAQRTGAQWVDVTSVMLKERNLRAYLCDDGIHPNELGQSKIAEAVLGALS
jgi:lysophospholipase L1-like esterase